MSYICSIGTSIPPYELKQEEIQSFVREIFPREKREIERLLPVFENAHVAKRQFVVPESWFGETHNFADRNKIYQDKALTHSLEAIDNCLSNSNMLTDPIPYQDIDLIIFVSSTGISTPTIDAHIINERSFRDDVKRLPIWGLGCAGGSSGMARAMDYVNSHPTDNVLVVCVELCGLTFQKNDSRKSNFIGTALFGDGISAAVVLGKNSRHLDKRKKSVPKMIGASSKIKKDALDVMGWNVNDYGLQVIFSRSIPALVDSFWAEHIKEFSKQLEINPFDLPFYVAHPGGAKVLQAFQDVLNCDKSKFKHSYDVLYEHGNMSSVTVLHVLKRWMEEEPKGARSVMAALGPGFSSELVGLEWEK